MSTPTVRPIRPVDVDAVHALIIRSFDAYVGPGYSAEGIATFRRYVDPDDMRERISSDPECALFAAELEERLAGMVQLREWRHISLLFVEPGLLHRGVGSALLRHVLDACETHTPRADQVTVNSSPYAVPFYERHGFTATGEATTIDGIVSTPMSYALS